MKWDDEMITLTVTDASWAGENHEARVEMEPLHSPESPHDWLGRTRPVSGGKDLVHPICFASNTIRRFCKSTLQAETLALLWGVEAGAHSLRCPIT